MNEHQEVERNHELANICKGLQKKLEKKEITQQQFDQEICYVSLQDKYGFTELRFRPQPTPVTRSLKEYMAIKSFSERREYMKKFPNLFTGPKNSHWLKECEWVDSTNFRNKLWLEFMLKTLADDKKAVAKINTLLDEYAVKDVPQEPIPKDIQDALDMFNGSLAASTSEEE